MGSISWYSGSVLTAQISAFRNTPASGNNVELRFNTASAGTSTERLRITNNGQAQFKAFTANANISLQSNPTAIELYNTSGIVRNWQISAQNINSQCIDITPSTANGGTTYSTPILTIDGEQGRVGIGTGTTRPSQLFHVYTTSSDDNGGHIKYENGSTGTGSAANAQLIGKSKYGTAQMMVWENYGLRFGMRSTANGGAGSIHFTSGNDAVGMTLVGSDLTVNGGTSVAGRRTGGYGIFTGGFIGGNIAGNVSGSVSTYWLLKRLDEDSGYIARGTLICASWTNWNVSDFYLRKAYASTSVTVSLTGISKSAQDVAVVDINYGGYRWLSFRFTVGNGEIDAYMTGFSLMAGGLAIVTSGVTENSVLASY